MGIISPNKKVGPGPDLEPINFLTLSERGWGGNMVESLLYHLGSSNLVCEHNFTKLKGESRTSFITHKFLNRICFNGGWGGIGLDHFYPICEVGIRYVGIISPN